MTLGSPKEEPTFDVENVLFMRTFLSKMGIYGQKITIYEEYQAKMGFYDENHDLWGISPQIEDLW